MAFQPIDLSKAPILRQEAPALTKLIPGIVDAYYNRKKQTEESRERQAKIKHSDLMTALKERYAPQLMEAEIGELNARAQHHLRAPAGDWMTSDIKELLYANPGNPDAVRNAINEKHKNGQSEISDPETGYVATPLRALTAGIAQQENKYQTEKIREIESNVSVAKLAKKMQEITKRRPDLNETYASIFSNLQEGGGIPAILYQTIPKEDRDDAALYAKYSNDVISKLSDRFGGRFTNARMAVNEKAKSRHQLSGGARATIEDNLLEEYGGYDDYLADLKRARQENAILKTPQEKYKEKYSEIQKNAMKQAVGQGSGMMGQDMQSQDGQSTAVPIGMVPVNVPTGNGSFDELDIPLDKLQEFLSMHPGAYEVE